MLVEQTNRRRPPRTMFIPAIVLITPDIGSEPRSVAVLLIFLGQSFRVCR